MAFLFAENVRYRIQNVDYATFLELRAIDNRNTVVMRLSKESEKQQVGQGYFYHLPTHSPHSVDVCSQFT